MKKVFAWVLSLTMMCSLLTDVVPGAAADSSAQIDTANELSITAIIQPTNKYDWVGKYSNGLAAAKKDGKWGYLDKSAAVVVPLEYDSALAFYDGFAIVGTDSSKSRKYGVIDTSGNTILPLQYDAVGRYESFFFVTLGDKYGLFDRSGNIVMPVEYDALPDFTNGPIRVKGINGKYGFINETGAIVADFVYDEADSFGVGFAFARVKKGDKWGFINTSGEVAIPIEYTLAFPYSEGLASVSREGSWDYIDTAGNVTIPLGCDFAFPFAEGFACVRIGDKYGFINTSGETVIPFAYDNAYDFKGGFAPVQKGDQWGIINTAGEEVVPIEYDAVGVFSDTEAYLGEVTHGDGLARVVKDGKEGLVDKTGKIVVPVLYDYAESSVDSDIAIVKKDGKYGLINREGEIVLPIEYDNIPHDNQSNEFFSDYTTWIMKDGKWSLFQINDSVSANSLAAADTLTVSCGITLTFNKEALAVLDHTKAVVINVKNADKNILNAQAQGLVGDRPLFDISATQNSEHISDFRDGQISISIPYTLSDGENPNCVLAYNIDSAGKPTLMKGRYKDGLVTFMTNDLSTYGVGYNKVIFNDVPDEAWYADAIDYIAAREIANGMGEGIFSPLGGATRAQFVKLICETNDIEPINDNDNFADAYGPDGKPLWYTSFLAAAKQAGIIKGVGENKFNPDGSLTRQEMFTMLYRTLKELKILPVGEGRDIGTFDDYKSVADWAEEAMAYLTANGIIKGYDNNKLNPLDPASRAEMSQVLYNILILE